MNFRAAVWFYGINNLHMQRTLPPTAPTPHPAPLLLDFDLFFGFRHKRLASPIDAWQPDNTNIFTAIASAEWNTLTTFICGSLFVRQSKIFASLWQEVAAACCPRPGAR